jgi:hypothetical protein
MTVTVDLRDELMGAFASARDELIAAQLRQGAKDTPANRSAVQARMATIDRLLDLFLELGPVAVG